MVTFVRYGQGYVTARWAWLLRECRRRGWRGALTGPRSGARTYAQQLALYLLWRAGKGAPAFNPNGPSRHMRRNVRKLGGWAQAVDVGDPDDLIRAAKKLGIALHQPYWKEPWHIEAVRVFVIRKLGVSRDERLVALMRRHGVVYPRLTLAAAQKAGLPIAYACAMLEKESLGGANVFGHDPVKSPQIVGGPVTKQRYQQYKRLRGSHGMQGVGGTQLTYYTVQDRADALGGCWRPQVNMFVGFTLLKGLIRRYGAEKGAAAYNGTGPRATAYGEDFVRKARSWKRLLG